jgi:hypothetical protein
VRYAIPATYKLRRHATAGYPHRHNGRARGDKQCELIPF